MNMYEYNSPNTITYSCALSCATQCARRGARARTPPRSGTGHIPAAPFPSERKTQIPARSTDCCYDLRVRNAAHRRMRVRRSHLPGPRILCVCRPVHKYAWPSTTFFEWLRSARIARRHTVRASGRPRDDNVTPSCACVRPSV